MHNCKPSDIPIDPKLKLIENNQGNNSTDKPYRH